MKKIDVITLSTKTTALLGFISIFMVFGGAALFYLFVGPSSNYPLGIIGVMVVFFLTGVLHEIVHGIGYWISGAKPNFGAGFTNLMPYFYTSTKQKIPLKPMLITAYLPFFILSILFVLFGLAFPEYRQIAVIGFLSNFTGSVGDLWIASKLWKYQGRNNVLISDQKFGVEVYVSNKSKLS